MNGTPSSAFSYDISASKSVAPKRDSLAAELERDPRLSAARRQQRAQAFTSTMAHASLERQLVAAQTTKMEMETKLREKEMLIERLERDRRWFADREKEEREEKERERAEYDEEKRKTDNDLRSLRSALTTLREEHADLEETHSSSNRNTSQTITLQKSQISTLERQVFHLTQELEEFKRIAEDRSRAVQDMQEQLEDVNAAQDSIIRKGAEEENMAVVREELHRQANYLRALEVTNTRLNAKLTVLRERHTSLEVLREEKRGLERRLESHDVLSERVVKLEAEVEAGRKEREDWARKASDSTTPAKTPIGLTQTLSTLRLTYARLLEEHGANVALLRSREAELADAERRNTEANEKITTMEDVIRSTKDQAERKERSVLVAEREISFLQALVVSFNAEDAAQDFSHVDVTKDERIRQLETLLGEYKLLNSQLTKEIDALDGDASSLGQGHSRKGLSRDMEEERTRRIEIQKTLEAVEIESRQHLDRIEELEQSLFELGGEMGGGRHVPPNTRVLSLKENPEQQWFNLRQAAMDRLKGENEALMKRLKGLEEGGAIGEVNAEELVPRESWDLINKENKELEDMVKQKEKRLLRLQQVFTSKSAEFREAIASILGLKLAFYPNGQVRVTSMYDLSASFVFQAASKTEGAKMQLVAQGEGGPSELPDMMRIWIENEQCIPGFLASVTLLCFDAWKQKGKLDVM